jgi:hypothetical protein
MQYLYIILVEYHSCCPHCIRTVEGLLYGQIDADPEFYLMRIRSEKSRLPKIMGIHADPDPQHLTTVRSVGRKVNFTHRGAAALLFCTTVMAVVVNGLRLLRSTKLEEYLLGVRYVGIIIPFASSTRARQGSRSGACLTPKLN